MPPDSLDGLSDGVVSIRLVTVEDASAFAGAFRDDPTLGVMIGNEADPTEADIVSRVEAGASEGTRTSRLHAIASADTGEFLGGIGIYRVDAMHGHGEVGFWLTAAARGHGAGTRAVRLVTDWAFDTLGVHRVEITTTPDNTATLRLAAGLGFREEGVMRERNLERGGRVDVVMMAVLESEWSD